MTIERLAQLMPFPPDAAFPSAPVCDLCDRECATTRNRAVPLWAPEPEFLCDGCAKEKR